MEPPRKVRVIRAGSEATEKENRPETAEVCGEKAASQTDVTTDPSSLSMGSGKLCVLSDVMQKCLNLLTFIMKQNYALYFNEPVDYRKLNIPDYPSIISRPMDLGTIQSNLTKAVYTDPEAFASDVRLVWANAMTYNAPSNVVHQQAMRFSELFERRFRRVAAEGSSSSRSSQTSQDSEDKPSNTTQHTGRHLNTPPMTMAEKRQLKKNIIGIKEKSEISLQSIVALIRSAAPETEKGDHLVVDLNTLDNATLRQLQTEVVKVNALLELR